MLFLCRLESEHGSSCRENIFQLRTDQQSRAAGNSDQGHGIGTGLAYPCFSTVYNNPLEACVQVVSSVKV